MTQQKGAAAPTGSACPEKVGIPSHNRLPPSLLCQSRLSRQNLPCHEGVQDEFF